MKKVQLFSAVICVLLSMILSSCEKNIFEKEFSPQQFFNIHMIADKDGKSFEADVICSSYESIEIAFTYPKELSGFSVESTGDSFNINAFGVADELKSEDISNSSLLNVLVKSIRIAVFTNHGAFTTVDNKTEANIIADSVDVRLVFDEEGYISSLSAPRIGFSAEFQNQG